MFKPEWAYRQICQAPLAYLTFAFQFAENCSAGDFPKVENVLRRLLHAHAPTSILRIFAEQISHGLSRLNPLAVDACQLLLERLNCADDNSVTSKAGLLTQLADRLDAIGEPQRARDAAEESVGLLRQLVRQDKTKTPVLVSALISLARCCVSVDLASTGIQFAQEAAFRSRHWLMDMGGLRQHLNALDTLAECLSHSGDDVGALVTVENALSILAVAKKRSDDLTPEEALLHRRHAFILIRMQRFGPALASATLSMGLAQALAFADELRFAPCYFDAVCSLIECRAHLGLPLDSDAMVDEAVDYFETLVQVDPMRFVPCLIDRLIRLSAAVAEVGSKESLTLAKRAAELAEEYAIAHPSSTAVDWAKVFSHLGEVCLENGNLRAASDAMRIAAGGSRPCPASIAVTAPDELSSDPHSVV